MKPSLSLEVSTLFDMALKLLLLLHMALKRLLFLHQEHAAGYQDVSKNLVLLINLKQNILVSRKLPMQTLQKLHLSNSLYIEQYTSHLLILLSSTRACSETTKQNSVCFEISFDKSLFLMETSQLICVADWLTDFFMMLEVWGFRLISGWAIFCWAHSFCRFLVELPVESADTMHFWWEFSCWGFFGVSVFLHGVISMQIIVLFFFDIFELALSYWSLFKADIN